MAKLQIVDTGYLNTARTGSVVTRVNSGSAMVINSALFRLRDKVAVDDSPVPGNSDNSVLNRTSFDNNEFDLDIVLKKTVAADRLILQHIVGIRGNSSYPGLKKTSGVKAISINSAAGSDVRKTMVELIGNTATAFHGNEVTTGYPTLLCLITNISSVDNSESDNFKVTLTCKEF